jgi:hypothetical protein
MGNSKFSRVASKDNKVCDAHLGSEDRLPDGWWNVPLSESPVCEAQATVLYTQNSGTELYLCDRHVTRYEQEVR